MRLESAPKEEMTLELCEPQARQLMAELYRWTLYNQEKITYNMQHHPHNALETDILWPEENSTKASYLHQALSSKLRRYLNLELVRTCMPNSRLQIKAVQDLNRCIVPSLPVDTQLLQQVHAEFLQERAQTNMCT
jgi:hypothetical protein